MAENPLITRLRMRLDHATAIQRLDELVLKNSMLGGEPYSFKDHEWQREFIRDASLRIYLRKCSQVGASEAAIAKTLALLAALSHIRLIYTLPTAEMASKFSKDRIDNAIMQSPVYGPMMKAANNSASQKQIGSNVLYVGGSFGDTAAISVPATVLIHDELDFSNPVVIGKMTSRLRHADMVDEYGNRGIRYGFSTPTVDGYGVDVGFQKGTQKYYMVQCRHCGTRQAPEYFTHLHIPGLEGGVSELTREKALEHQRLLSGAQLLCEHCGKDLQDSLMDPDRREWVAAFPERGQQSYQISPWDVPKYNTPAQIVTQILDYPLLSDYLNYTIGIPHTDKENSFDTSDVFKARVKQADKIAFQAGIVARSCVLGLDVGKLCHLIVGLPMGTKLHIVNAVKIPNTRAEPAAPKILAYYDFYRCTSMVVDAGPDVSLVNELTKSRPELRAAVYVRTLHGPKILQVKKDEPVVNVDRTKSMTLLMNRHNSGDILYPKDDTTTNAIFTHLKTTKKIRRQNPDGSITELFVASSKEDHWVHALHYCMVAKEIRYGWDAQNTFRAPVTVGVARIGGALAEDEDAHRPWWAKRRKW